MSGDSAGVDESPDSLDLAGPSGLPDPDLVDFDTAFGPPARVGSWELIAGGVLLVVALVIVFALTAGGGDDDDDDVATPAATDQTPSNGDDPTPTGDPSTPGQAADAPSQPPITPLPADVPATPEVALPIVVDDFERPDDADSIGEANGGQAWDPVLGTWGIADGKALLTESNPVGGPRNVVISEGTTVTQGSISAEFDPVAQGTGVVFRYRNAFNYFVLSANAEFDLWHLTRIVDGEDELIGLVRNAPAEGKVLVTVQLKGFWIYVYVNDEPYLAVRDEQLGQAGGIGLYANGAAAGEAAFSGFIAGRFDTVSPPAGEAGGDTAPGTDAP